MVTILMQIVEHLAKISMFLKDLNLFRVCFFTWMRLFNRRPTPPPREFFRETWYEN